MPHVIKLSSFYPKKFHINNILQNIHAPIQQNIYLVDTGGCYIANARVTVQELM